MSTITEIRADDSGRLGNYRILRLLGRGGMGDVYLAWTGLRLVAVKILHPHYASDATFVAMFLAEARVAGKINHSAIAQVLDVGVDAGRLYMAMEYVAGHTLDDLIADSSLPGQMLFPLRLGTTVFANVAQALAAAHRAQIVHRDISPHNILISDTGALKLIDFGIARTQNTDSRTSPGTFRGRFGYMAPEYVQGHECDHRVDLFALGVVMWETFTRRRLYGGAAAAQLYAVIERPAERLDAVLPDFPPRLADVVARLLERDPNARYQHATEVADELEGLLPELPDGGFRNLAHWVDSNLSKRVEARARADHADMQAAAEEDSIGAESFEPIVEVTAGGSVRVAPPTASSPSASRWGLALGLGGLVLGLAALVIWILGRVPAAGSPPPAPAPAPEFAAAAVPAPAPIPPEIEAPPPTAPEVAPEAPPEVPEEPELAIEDPEVKDTRRAPASEDSAPKRPRSTKKDSTSRRSERISSVTQPLKPATEPTVAAPTIAKPAVVPVTIPSIAPPPPPPPTPAPAPVPRTPRVPASMLGDEAQGGKVVGQCNACHAEKQKRRIDGKHMTRKQWERFFRNGTHDRYLSLGGRLSLSDLAAAKAFLSARALDASQDQSAGVR
ncbi:MAG: serine/threonine-protein kinase [Kofleriaceae bacterium]